MARISVRSTIIIYTRMRVRGAVCRSMCCELSEDTFWVMVSCSLLVVWCCSMLWVFALTPLIRIFATCGTSLCGVKVCCAVDVLLMLWREGGAIESDFEGSMEAAAALPDCIHTTMESACSESVDRICESEFSETLEAEDDSEERVSETTLEVFCEALHE